MKHIQILFFTFLLSISFNISLLSAENKITENFEIVKLEEVPVYQTKMETSKSSLSAARLKSELTSENTEKVKSGISDWNIETKSSESIAVLGSNMLKGLAFCVGIVLLGFAFMKKMKFTKNRQMSKCNIIETLKLTDKSKLVLIEIEGQKIALTVGQERVEQVHINSTNNSKLKVQNKTEKHIINQQGLELLCQ